MVDWTHQFLVDGGRLFVSSLKQMARQMPIITLLLMCLVDSINRLSNNASTDCGTVVIAGIQLSLLTVTVLGLLVSYFSACLSGASARACMGKHFVDLSFGILSSILWFTAAIISILECPVFCGKCSAPVPGGSSCQCWTFQSVTDEIYTLTFKIFPHLGLFLCFTYKSFVAFRTHDAADLSEDSTEGNAMHNLAQDEAADAVSIANS